MFVSWQPDTRQLLLGTANVEFQLFSLPECCTVSQSTCSGQALSLTIRRITDGLTVQADYSILGGPFPYVRLLLSSENAFTEPFSYPPAVVPQAGDVGLYPYMEGVRFRAEDETALLPEIMSFHSCETSSMSFWAIQRGKSALLCAAVTNLDAGIRHSRQDGLLRTDLFWEPIHGGWGQTRELRFYPIDRGGVTEVCKAYRSIMAEKGLLVTLEEKIRAVPKVERMLGAADIWLWNDDAMHKLYDPDSKATPPTQAQRQRRREIAADLRSSGLERVMWSFFDEHTNAEDVAYAQSLGWLTTIYDIYTDVIPAPIREKIPDVRVNRCKNRMPYWPDGMQVQADGSLRKAWQLKGKDGVFYDQNYMCDAVALECGSKTIPAHTAELGLDGRFIDNFYGFMSECYHPDHPTTRTSSLEYKNRLMQSLIDQGLVTGTEVGREDGAACYHYNEGNPSPILYRAYDAGRRMTHTYYGEQIDEKLRRYMLNPQCRVPLWELVFHDCVISYWYWGDSSNCCPELTRVRDLFCLLYGMPSLFSLDMSRYEELKSTLLASYARTSDFTREVGTAELTEFLDLTPDGMIQRSIFSNGISVTVNFSDQPYVCDSEVIGPLDYRIERKD